MSEPTALQHALVAASRYSREASELPGSCPSSDSWIQASETLWLAGEARRMHEFEDDGVARFSSRAAYARARCLRPRARCVRARSASISRL